MSSKSTKNGACTILVTQKDAITKIAGKITPKSIDTLKNELGGAFTMLKSTIFAEGEQYGYLACVKRETFLNKLSGVYMSMGRRCFVFLFHHMTEQPHQGDMNNPTSMLKR
jgi:hypothetical protein